MNFQTHRKTVKNLLRRNKWPGLLGGKYAFSPYQACAHACKYCDGRAERYYVEGDFERDITVRVNSPELLLNELQHRREFGPICIGSGVSDPYQPAEKTERLMARCCEVLAEHAYPVVVMTKSALVRRDLPYFKTIHSRGGFLLMMTLTMLDDRLRSVIEPGAATVEDRLATLEEFRSAGLDAGVLAMPILPLLADGESDIDALFSRFRLLGVQFILPMALTLKPGRQKDCFMTTIGDHFPEYLDHYRRLYGADDQWGKPARDYLTMMTSRLRNLAAKHRLPTLAPHGLYRTKFMIHDELLILLRDMQELYATRGVDIRPLRRACRAYHAWLEKRRTFYARRRNLDYAGLTDEVTGAIARDELLPVIGNGKLNRFIKKVAVERREFDYLTLRLR
ncbi:radical SAM protein [bacterium]|nr:radical SAM protein [candidate division CSSED10-310 bacterium]